MSVNFLSVTTANLQFTHVISAIVICVAAFNFYKYRRYKKGAYYQITKASYFFLKYNAGKYGEYLIYKHLRYFENTGAKFLFNLYIPKGQNQKTEIDVLLICAKGLIVFESKNFGGWIFGNEAHQKWTQVFPKGYGRSHKEQFYNPVLQNAGHVRHLKAVVGGDIPAYSIIVFSDRCTLKDVTVNSRNVNVVYQSAVVDAVDQIYDQGKNDLLTKTEIDDLYSKLYPYTQVTSEEAEQHVERILKF